MWQGVKYRNVQIAGVLTALGNIAAKWLIGVLVQKLILLGGGNSDNLSNDSSPLYTFVFLQNISFSTVAYLSIAVTFLLSLFSASMQSMALVNSAQTARSLRNQILQCAIGGTGADATNGGSNGGDITQAAHNLILHVELMENFRAYDEHWILVNWIIL